MNEKQLLLALNDVDDRFILAAAPGKQVKKRGSWLKWGALAACLILVVTAFIWTPSFWNIGNSSGAAATIADTDEAEATEDAYAGAEAREEDSGYDITGELLFSEELCSQVSEIRYAVPEGQQGNVTDADQIAQVMELLSAQAYTQLEQETSSKEVCQLELVTPEAVHELSLGKEGVVSVDGIQYSTENQELTEDILDALDIS